MITLLGPSEIEITEIKLLEGNTLNIWVKSTKEGCNCHQCGKSINQFHGSGEEIKLRHLPIFNYKTFILINPKRYYCKYCNNNVTTTQEMDWHTPKVKQTKPFEESVLLDLINNRVKDVSLKKTLAMMSLRTS